MMEPADSITWHEYRPTGPLAAVMRGALITGIIGVPLLLAMVSSLLPAAGLVLLLALPLLGVGAMPLLGLLIATADLGSSRQGLTLRVLGPFTIFLPWPELKHCALWQTPVPAPIRWALLRRWPLAHAVYVPGRNGLIPAGLLFGLGRLPVFIITPDHQDASSLIKRLEHFHHPLTQASRQRAANRWSPRQ